MTDEIVNNITNRYIELYEHITGDKFQKSEDANLLSRIELNVKNFLNK
jgi:phosphoribosylaminoimidazole-succinocarboxamide synthase